MSTALGNLSNAELGFVVASVPTISMILASALMSSIKVSTTMESILQYFCGGLIVAAVAAELFPLMLENVSSSDSMIGVTVGFAVGLSMVYGMEWVMEYIERNSDDETKEDELTRKRNSSLSLIASFAVADGVGITGVVGGSDPESIELGVEHGEPHRHSPARVITSALPADDDETAKELEQYQPLGSPEPQGEWNEEDVRASELAISDPQHRSHVREHVKEIVDKINDMNEKSLLLLDSAGDLSVKDQERLAEEIDEGVHQLQYLLDHTRRLVEGAESAMTGARAKIWLTDDRKRTLRRRITALRYSAEHLQEHIDEEVNMDVLVLQEVHAHMADMDKQITFFHDSVQKAASRWGRKAYTLPDPELGDVIPAGLVVPVTIDCFVDGFLIGVTVALSPKAGVILGAANVLEMGSLGMAYAVRLKNCTGSPFLTRMLALYLPPCIMLLSSGLGAELAAASQAIPAVFVGFVAFGTVALLALACNELFIEAQKALGDDAPSYPSMFLFLGVWLVLIVDQALGH